MGLVVAGGDTLLFYMCWSRSLVAQTVKNLPAVQETWIQFPGQEDPAEKGMPAHSHILVHGQRNLAGYSPWGHRV